MWWFWFSGGWLLAAELDDAAVQRDLAGRGTPAEQAAAARAVVHEWGTFTSVHRPDGAAVTWASATPTHPLPTFVSGPIRRGEVLAESVVDCATAYAERRGKDVCRTRIRMETPVIYVHVDAPARMRVRVDFPAGFHTEWYPPARYAQGPILDWGWFTATPGPGPALIHEPEASPYYAARDVDAATLTVDDHHERFLFYRGVGEFDPTVHPRVDGTQLSWDGLGAAELIVYRSGPDGTGAAALSAAGTIDVSRLPPLDPRELLRSRLLVTGLYPDEVEAMLATWEGEWFEPGLRAFYVLPSAEVDRRLPLTLEPEPRELVRVIVARAELLDPAGLARAAQLTDAERAAAFGRFADAYDPSTWAQGFGSTVE